MQLIGTNLLPVPIGPSQPGTKHEFPTQPGMKYCPTMDLVAIFTQALPADKALDAANAENSSSEDYYGDDEDELFVDVYRPNGQKVFTINIESHNRAIGVVDVSWRDDGIILAIATSDNQVRLVNSFSGKIVHTFSALSSISGNALPSRSPSSKRKSIGAGTGSRKRRCMPTSTRYSTHFSDPRTARHQLGNARQEKGTVLDDLLSLNADIDQLLKVKADLPKELANIDVERFLPKLATLPANGMGEDDVFSTRTSIDTMFHPQKSSAGSPVTDVVAIAQSDAHVHLRVFDSFEVGDVNLNHGLNSPPGCHLQTVRNIVSHPFSDKLYAIVEEGEVNHTVRHTRSQDVADTEGHTLHLLSLDLRFMRQSTHMLPMLATKATQLHHLIRYLRQIETQLAREVKTAFDLPGRFIRSLEEDLKEQDGEGSTFATSAYHALVTGEMHGKYQEWLVDILGDRGVKRWEKAVYECLELVRRLTGENWNPAIERAGIVISRLTGLAAASSTFDIDKQVLEGLKDTVDVMGVLGEDLLRDTNAEIDGFNAFIKWLKKEVEMAGLEDTSEKLDEMREGTDHSEVKKVLNYISERLQDTSVKKYIRDQTTTIEPDEEESDIYQSLKKLSETGAGSNAAPSMKSLTTKLTKQCERLFQQVAIKLRESVLVQYDCKLAEDIDPAMLDARVVYQPEYAVLHVVGRHSTMDGQVCCLRKSLDTRSAEDSSSTDVVKVDNASKILDIKIADDQTALILAQVSSHVKVIGMSLDDSVGQSIRHEFGGRHDRYTGAGLKPWKLDVNGRKKRRTMTVLDEDGQGYGVFDLDSTATEEGHDEVMSG